MIWDDNTQTFLIVSVSIGHTRFDMLVELVEWAFGFDKWSKLKALN